MVMVLEQLMIAQIADIGRQRAPHEACGLLLPTPVRGVQVVELANHAVSSTDSFEMKGAEMLQALEMIFQGDVPESIIPGLTVWHTHPSGGVGPSRFDLRNKPANLSSLVVTLFDDGRPPLATRF